MEINSWTLYWFTRLDSISNFLQLFSIFFMCATIAFIIVYFLSMDRCLFDSKFWDSIRNNRNKIVILFFIWSTLIYIPCIFIPTTKEMAFIYLTPKIVNNKEIQKLPINAVKLLNTKMEQYINGIDKEQ